jgi:hypothetical protein
LCVDRILIALAAIPADRNEGYAMSCTVETPPADELVDFTSIAREYRVNPSTVWRWALKGARRPDGTRDYLDAWRLPGRWMTTRDAVGEFIRRQTEARREIPAPAAPRTPAARRRDLARVDRELTSLGL